MNYILQKLISLLPRYAEEGSDASGIKKSDIFIVLIKRLAVSEKQAIQTTLNLVEDLLTSLSLLDNEALQRDEWKFVSHPAQLCALSLLHTLADPRQKLFPSSFWQTAGVGDEEKQQQKIVLEALENRRHEFHLEDNAPPIRFVYVAWSIIKLGNKILFHQREATEHADEYGLIGGRLNPRDLKKVMGEETPNHELLEVLQSPHSEIIFKALDFTLHRECEEEAKLIYAAGHYTAKIWSNLNPWQKCMGAAPNYALTQYFFRIYQLTLTTTGYLALRRGIKEKSEIFIECSLDEVVCGQTSDGAKKLRINAIYDDFNDRQALREALENLSSSYTNRYSFSEEKDSLIFSLTENILQGEPGKEKPLSISFTSAQKSLLMGIAAHGKGLTIQTDIEKMMVLHEYGWIEVRNSEIKNMLMRIIEMLRKADAPYLEISDKDYFRISFPPHLIFFDPALFCYQLEDTTNKNWLLHLRRESIITAFGEVVSDSKQITMKRNLAVQLKQAALNTITHGENEDLPRKIRSALQAHYQAIGLKRLLIIRDKYYGIACKSLSIPPRP